MIENIQKYEKFYDFDGKDFKVKQRFYPNGALMEVILEENEKEIYKELYSLTGELMVVSGIEAGSRGLPAPYPCPAIKMPINLFKKVILKIKEDFALDDNDTGNTENTMSQGSKPAAQVPTAEENMKNKKREFKKLFGNTLEEAQEAYDRIKQSPLKEANYDIVEQIYQAIPVEKIENIYKRVRRNYKKMPVDAEKIREKVANVPDNVKEYFVGSDIEEKDADDRLKLLAVLVDEGVTNEELILWVENELPKAEKMVRETISPKAFSQKRRYSPEFGRLIRNKYPDLNDPDINREIYENAAIRDIPHKILAKYLEVMSLSDLVEFKKKISRLSAAKMRTLDELDKKKDERVIKTLMGISDETKKKFLVPHKDGNRIFPSLVTVLNDMPNINIEEYAEKLPTNKEDLFKDFKIGSK